MVINKIKEVDDYSLRFSVNLKKEISQRDYFILDQNLSRVFNKRFFGINLVEVVTAVRTVLSSKGLNPEAYDLWAVIETNCEKNTVEYQSGEFTSYHKSLLLVGGIKIILEYKNNTISTKIKNVSLPTALTSKEIINSAITCELQKIKSFEKISEAKLTEDDVDLITAYRLFYDSFPDFSANETETFIRCMLYILKENNIKIFNVEELMNYTASPGNSSTLYLRTWMDKLTPFTCYQVFDLRRFSNECIKEIKRIGQMICKYLATYPANEQATALIDFCNIYYNSRCNLISQNNDCVHNEAICLIRKLDEKKDAKN